MSTGSVDISVLRISFHAVDRYIERVMHGAAITFANRGRATRRIAALLHYAEPLPPAPNCEPGEHRFKLARCVAVERAGSVTTILTDAMHLRDMKGEAL